MRARTLRILVGIVLDVAVWVMRFNLLGGRSYHVATDPELYFKASVQPIRTLCVWDGGSGIPGAVALVAWIACRRKGIAHRPLGSLRLDR